MASLPTSKSVWLFMDRDGVAIDRPDEWSSAFIDIQVEPSEWETVEARVQGVAKDVQVRRIGGSGRVVVPWERSPAGRYRIEVTTADHTDERSITVSPTKITQPELEQMVDDLETRLAPTIALALQQMGAFAGLRINPPGESTLAAEMKRVRVAVNGDNRTRGLLALLPEIGRDPHRMLHTKEPWVKTERARRPSPARLAAAFAKQGNLNSEQVPLTVADRRVVTTFDVYENRLLKLFVKQLEQRLRRLRSAAQTLGKDGVAEEAVALGRELKGAEQRAPFLEDVAGSPQGASQVSMVLLKRSDYRAMLSAYQRYRRHATVVVEDPIIEAPLSDVPGLYELWGTMKVAEALLLVAEDLGFRVDKNEFVRRRGGDLRLVSRGSSVQLVHPMTGVKVRLRDQPSYATGGSGLHSISFRQIPDVAVEITRPGGAADVYLFDPKYKVQSPLTRQAELGDGGDQEAFPGGPKKIDIDKMHAYRDAIRRGDGSRAVAYAAILYPGEGRAFTPGLEAVQCRPNQSVELERELRSLLTGWLDTVAAVRLG